MIIRSGLVRNRDGVNFAAFSEHWRRVHGPLALRVEAMRAYRQNHILERLPAPEGGRLHRVDGISQLWFDDVESMLQLSHYWKIDSIYFHLIKEGSNRHIFTNATDAMAEGLDGRQHRHCAERGECRAARDPKEAGVHSKPGLGSG